MTQSKTDIGHKDNEKKQHHENILLERYLEAGQTWFFSLNTPQSSGEGCYNSEEGPGFLFYSSCGLPFPVRNNLIMHYWILVYYD